MKKRSRTRNISEYVLARSVIGATRIIPYGMLPWFSARIGGLLFRILSSRRRVVADNLKIAYGGSTEAPDAERIARASLSNLCQSFLEVGRLPRSGQKFLERLRFRNPEAWEKLLALHQEGPLILVGAHFGAYEVCAAMSPLVGLNNVSLVRPLDNPLLEAWLLKKRTRYGQRLASNRGGLQHLLQHLSEGHVICMMADLNHRRNRRLWPTFFGVPAATAPTAALLSLRTMCPVIPIWLRRGPIQRGYELEVGQPILPNKGAPRNQEMTRILQAVQDQVERIVRAEPHLWLWTHRRWKTRPDAETSPGDAQTAAQSTN